jgi:hypothetical protein
MDIACMMCAVDPQTTSLLLPVAQATVISLPIIFRRDLARLARGARSRLRDAPRSTRPERPPDPPTG